MANIGVTVHMKEEDEINAHSMEIKSDGRIVHVLALGEVSVFLSIEQMIKVEEAVHIFTQLNQPQKRS